MGGDVDVVVMIQVVIIIAEKKVEFAVPRGQSVAVRHRIGPFEHSLNNKITDG